MRNFIIGLNAISVIGIFIIIGLASLIQFIYHEPPCPLCLLQRFGLLLSAFGFLLNLRFKVRARYYAFAVIGALFVATVSARQILLHIVPGTGAYGNPIFGLHLYTWAFIISAFLILWVCFNLLFDKYYLTVIYTDLNQKIKILIHILFLLIILLGLLNMITVFLECGIGICSS